MLSAAATAQEKIGQITSISGNGTITREDIEFRALPNAPLVTGDMLVTYPESSMGFSLADGSKHMLGEKSGLSIKEFSFQPDNPAASMIMLRLHKGTVTSRAGTIKQLQVDIRCGMVKAEDADLTIHAGEGENGPRDMIANYGGPLQVVIDDNATLVQAGSSVRLDESCDISFGALPADRESIGSEDEQDEDQRVEPPGPPEDRPPPQPTGQPGPGQPGPPSPRPTPPVATPTPPVPTPTRSPGPPTPSPSPPPPSPTPTPTPESPL